MALANPYQEGEILEGIEKGFQSFPYVVGDWKGRDLPVSPRVYEILETKNVIVREYENPAGEKVQLCLVASDRNRKVVHPPEVCYRGFGYEVNKEDPVKLSWPGTQETLTASRLWIQRPNDSQVVLYWYKIGSAFTTSYYRQQWQLALSQLKGDPNRVALIRISSPTSSQNPEKTLRLLKKFSQALIPNLS